MNIAVISLTERGRLLSLRIRDILHGCHEVKRYCFIKHSDDEADIFESIHDLTAELFDSTDALVFICACGIAVRACAPHIKSKISDPAVIAADENGRYVVPVLSGHIGGANRLSEVIAEGIGAEAVITTATDSGKLFSPDSFAAANGLIINDIKAAKEVASALVNGEKAGFFTEYAHSSLPKELTESGNVNTGIAVAADADIKPFPVTLNLVPRNIVVGIGCKRGTSSQAIEAAVKSVFTDGDFSRICAVATIDVKSDEQGLLDFCKVYGFPLFTYSAEELMTAEGDFESSGFVMKTVGTDNVCERSAVLCSGGELIIRKKSCGGITVAAAEKSVYLDLERKIL